MSDPEIERLEAELEQSRFAKWDVETLLADRHRAKIDALTRPESKRVRLWRVVADLASIVFVYVGQITLLALLGYWALLTL